MAEIINPRQRLLQAKTAIVAKCVWDTTDRETAFTLAIRYLDWELINTRYGKDPAAIKKGEELLMRTMGCDFAITIPYFRQMGKKIYNENEGIPGNTVERGIARSFLNLAKSLE